MIQGNIWHEYSNELKRFLCDVAKSRWARYLFYPLGVFVAIMYMTSQAGTHPYSFFSYVCDFTGCIVVIILCTMAVLSCIFTADYPYDKLRRRNRERDNQRIIAAFRKFNTFPFSEIKNIGLLWGKHPYFRCKTSVLLPKEVRCF